jgi:hypothetical protein
MHAGGCGPPCNPVNAGRCRRRPVPVVRGFPRKRGACAGARIHARRPISPTLTSPCGPKTHRLRHSLRAITRASPEAPMAANAPRGTGRPEGRSPCRADKLESFRLRAVPTRWSPTSAGLASPRAGSGPRSGGHDRQGRLGTERRDARGRIDTARSVGRDVLGPFQPGRRQARAVHPRRQRRRHLLRKPGMPMPEARRHERRRWRNPTSRPREADSLVHASAGSPADHLSPDEVPQHPPPPHRGRWPGMASRDGGEPGGR